MKKLFNHTLHDVEKTISFILLAASFIILSACRKTDVQSIVLPALNTANNSITGRVTDLYKMPVSNAMVTDGNTTTSTDNNGQFTIKNVHISKEFGSIRVSKQGFFPGSRTFLMSTNSMNNIKIILLPKIISGIFSAASGGTINISGGGSVIFSENSIVNAATGIGYQGNVSVYSFYLNPADTRFNEYMPGDLIGINGNNEQRILQSLGMVSVELNDEAGGKLQLAPGNKAIITFPIPDYLQALAPTNLPLWFFDETNGVWKEEGTAARYGNSYKGSVTHFSFWNCDLPAKYVKLELTLADQKGIPLGNYSIVITSLTYGTRNGYTDNKGMVIGLIPANENLIIKIYDRCGELIYTNNIGPFNTDVNLGNIIMPFTNTQINITLSGKVINCNNIPVTNGFVQVNSGNYNFDAPVVDGNFVITFPYCSNAVSPPTIIAYDLGNGWQSSSQIISIISSSQDLGQLKACLPLILL